MNKDKLINTTIGSDIEWFVYDAFEKKVISAEGLIRGTKYEPYKFDKKNKYFATSLDNVMAEGNIPPTKNAKEFCEHIFKLKNFIKGELPIRCFPVSLADSVLDEKYLQTENAKRYGCEPSLNCWTGDVVHPEPTEEPMRCAGFHIHVGYKNPHEGTNFRLAQAMDLFLGVPSILLEPKSKRKELGYGLAGNFRHQKHGMEYRSLSGYFAKEKFLLSWCFRNTKLAIKFIKDGRIGEIAKRGDYIQRTINNENKRAARRLVEEFNIPLP